MEKRNLYMEKIGRKLIQYNAKLTEMKGKTAEVQVDMKLEYLSQVDNLEKKRDELIKKHGQLTISSQRGWEDVKTGTEKVWDELEEAFAKAATQFK